MSNSTAIRLPVALRQMDTSPNFSLTYVSYNQRENKGGKLITLSNLKRIGFSAHDKHNRTINVETNAGEKIKVHQFLITAFNNQTVIL